MQRDTAEALAWESRWSRPVGMATLAAVVCFVVATVVGHPIAGSDEAAVLRSAHDHSFDLIVSSILQAIGAGLLAAPLYFLFRATLARSERVRRQFVGVIVVAPLFLCVAALVGGIATKKAADDFNAGKGTAGQTVREAGKGCGEERGEDEAKFREEFGKGAGAVRRCAREEVEVERAEAVDGGALRGLATGLAYAGRLGLAFALVYTCLYAMRVGLLTRFWGSFGIALGVASLLPLIQFTLIWFAYFGLLALGWIPGGRPPAWAAGEAIPWPTPGEKAADELGGDDGEEGETGGAREDGAERER